MSLLNDSFMYPSIRKAVNTITLPDCITNNLKPVYSQRPYQTEAFKRFIYHWEQDFDPPYHLLYNMATGSGKTLVMAGLILYLYEKGYRNFLFFVGSTTIIDKTKDNFVNPGALKYLFNQKIVIDGKEVHIKETDTFESADTENINIKFTTTHLLHSDLVRTKENSVTFEDFKDKQIVLIADEAHHLNSGTKKGDLFGSWEGTILELFGQNKKNILLEFTATLDFERKEIAKKYDDKVIYKYGLAQFREDKYSKEINLVRSLYDERERIVQALILNLYRQELANIHNINLKPVILFKAKKTIKESERNKTNFHALIEEMSPELIETIRKTSTVSIIQKAFSFFDANTISITELCKLIKWHFREENCMSANNDLEAELNQVRLNTLESENNPIRAIFAVQKLNEGWDVLNLFDIVRLYEGQNSGGSSKTAGATTLSEAQLIGRGARYFPFAIETTQNKFTRKYDHDPFNDLKILEELYYHTKEDSRYISELKKALIASGIYEDDEGTVFKELKLKQAFKESEIYNKRPIISNRNIPGNKKTARVLTDLDIYKKNHKHFLASGASTVSHAFDDNIEEEIKLIHSEKNLKFSDIPRHIIRSDFISDASYLGNLQITFVSVNNSTAAITNDDYMHCICELLKVIEGALKSDHSEYGCSEFVIQLIRNVIKDKTLKIPKNSEREDGQEDFLRDKNWYPYTANYGTSEEKAFVRFFARTVEGLQNTFKDIVLIRNERAISISDTSGRTFEPDFILLMTRKTDELNYQVFIEPKGDHLIQTDKWKEKLLLDFMDKREKLRIQNQDHLLMGAPFYNEQHENEFARKFEEALTAY